MSRRPVVVSVVIIATLLVLGGCQSDRVPLEPATALAVSTTTSLQASTPTTIVPEIIPGVPSVLYESQEYGFSLYRPENSGVQNQGFEPYLPLTQSPLVGIVLPKALSEGTNLGEAGVYLGVSASPEAVSGWDQPVAGSAEIAAGIATINGVSFAVFTASEAAAGNLYEERVLRTLRGATCFEVVEFLHSTNIGNYTPGTVTEFDKPLFQGYLEAITQTLTFGAH